MKLCRYGFFIGLMLGWTSGCGRFGFEPQSLHELRPLENSVSEPTLFPPAEVSEEEVCSGDVMCNPSNLPDDTGQSCANNAECTEACIVSQCGPFAAEGGACDELADCAGLGQCTFGVCIGGSWVGLGNSEMASWTEFITWGSASGGGISNSSGNSITPLLATNPSGNLVAVWTDGSAGNWETYALRFDGTAWRTLGPDSASGGGISQTAASSQNPALTLDASGEPVVAWQDGSSGGNEIYVRRFNGTDWQEVGSGSASGVGISNSGGNAALPVLTVDGSGNLVAAWSDRRSGNTQIYALRFNGTNWQEIGTGSATSGGISNSTSSATWPSLHVDAAGNPVIAWEDTGSGNREIYARRFNGTVWQEVGVGSATGGGISNNSGTSSAPSLSIDGVGNPVVAWSDTTTGDSEIYVRRFDGTNWQEAGAGSATGGGVSNDSDSSTNPSLSLDGDGNPVVAWSHVGSPATEIYVRRFNGTSWEEIGVGSASGGGVSNSPKQSMSAAMTMDALGNPVVAWIDSLSGNSEVYVRRFDGTSWQETHTGSATESEISQHSKPTSKPSLVLDRLDRPTLAWMDESTDDTEIYVRRFDGARWTELGAGSATGGGISNNTDSSSSPSMVLDRSDNPVITWTDRLTFSSWEIYVRQFDGSSWQEVGPGSATGTGISNTSGESSFPSLALDELERPVVAWADRTTGPWEIYVRRFDGTQWQEVGPGSANGSGVSTNPGSSLNPSLAINASGEPIIAWENIDGGRHIYVRQFDGTNWQEVGVGSASGNGVSNTLGDSVTPSLIVDRTGRPVVAWEDESSGRGEIYVRRFNGTNWEEVGASSATSGGVSNSPGNSSEPLLTLDDAGQLVVAWRDASTGNHEIYVRRFNGTNWEAVSNAAADGGVSNSSGESSEPSLSIQDRLLCVAYSETGPSAQQIAMRCTIP